MKHLPWVVVMLFVVFAPCAYANSIPVLDVNITYVTVSMFPNDGSGDNAFVTLIGPGTEITAFGGMACFAWCSGDIPDLNSVSLSQLFVGSFMSAKVLGTSYDPNSEFELSCCVFSDYGLLNASVSGQAGTGDTFAYLFLTLPSPGSWNLSFDGGEGDYWFVHGEFTAGSPPPPVPEPGALGLMATGFTGIFEVIRKKRLLCRSRAKLSS